MNNAMHANGNRRPIHPDEELLNRFSSCGANDRAAVTHDMFAERKSHKNTTGIGRGAAFFVRRPRAALSNFN